MTKTIVLDAGHAKYIPGNKTPDGIYEWTLNDKVATEVAKQLSEYDVKIHRVDDTTGKQDISLAERVSRTNKIMPEIFISIHHNAYNSKWGNHSGVETFYNPNRKNNTEKTIATEIAAATSENTGLTNHGAKTAAFYVLTCNPKITAILTEGGFMDSLIDHQIITSKKGQIAYAKAISETLIKTMKLKKKKQTEQKKASEASIKKDEKYTLQNNATGYFTAIDAAQNRDKRLNIQAGDYWVFNTSNAMINITKSKGYPGSWINPQQTGSASTPLQKQPEKTIKIGEKYTLKQHTPGYYTASDAKENRNQRVTVLAGEYIIFNISDDIINISKIPEKPGSWIKPT